MNLLRKISVSCLLMGGTLALALTMVGCGSTGQLGYDPVNPPRPYAFAGPVTNLNPVVKDPAYPAPVPSAAPEGSPQASHLRIGDWVTVGFSDTPIPLPETKTQIGEDGTVSLPYSVRVAAVGKTPRQLEQEIRAEYVPRIFIHLTVSVKTDQRAFFVGGEVKVPNRLPHIGDMTVLRAIQSAGDFTDFANRKKIDLIRDNGKKYRINWHEAIKNPKLDLPVYPNDQIIVHKRFW